MKITVDFELIFKGKCVGNVTSSIDIQYEDGDENTHEWEDMISNMFYEDILDLIGYKVKNISYGQKG